MTKLEELEQERLMREQQVKKMQEAEAQKKALEANQNTEEGK